MFEKLIETVFSFWMEGEENSLKIVEMEENFLFWRKVKSANKNTWSEK